ncbi:MAG TPA: SMC family ATPase, partial [Methanomicrobiales archaeon]|nr:SMC family ATPase [Methanomicrobiales archaeon]
MLLHSLQMNNFKRFREETIQFQDGITGIIGNNGAGKSTIVEAILFALYGIQGTGIDPDHIVSSFAGERDKATVRLDFSASGNDYTVIRYFRRTVSSTQHDAQLFLGGRQIAEGVTDVLQGIESIIGMGPTDLKNTIYTAQKDLLSLIESQPGERRRWFMKVLGIDALRDGADEEIKGLLDDRKQQSLDLTGRLKELDVESLQQHIATDCEREQELEKEHKALLDEKAAIAGEAERLRSSLLMLRKKEREYIRLNESWAARQDEIKSIAEECTRIEGEISERQMLRNELQRLEEQEKRFSEVEKDLEVQEGRRHRYEDLTAVLKQRQYEQTVHLQRKGALEEEE